MGDYIEESEMELWLLSAKFKPKILFTRNFNHLNIHLKKKTPNYSVNTFINVFTEFNHKLHIVAQTKIIV